MLNGIINVYKEPGFTSHDVVAKLRGITRQKKIGHTGTLDPAAVGVLCVCLGAATHVCDMLTDETKEYEAVMRLGIRTDTLDTTGDILETHPVDVDETAIREVVSHYVGDIEQIPPMYSALKVGGKKLYELARAGVEVERKPRPVSIFALDIVDISIPLVTIRVTCSKGTYIRTLCDDIGAELGCGAAMEHLSRTRVGRFCVEDAIKLDRLQELMDRGEIESALIGPDRLFDNCKVMIPNDRGEKLASNGNVIAMDDMRVDNVDAVSNVISLADGEQVRIMSEDGFFYGIYRYDEERNVFKPVKMFLCQTIICR